MNVTGKFRVAIVGASGLKGRELADMLKDRNFSAHDIRLLDDDESLGQLEAVGDELSFVQAVRPEHFEHVDFAFFASEESFTRRNWRMASDAGATIIDLSYGLEDQPGATVRSPWIERELNRHIALELAPAPVIAAHPAAQVLAVLLLRAQKVAVVQRAVAMVMEPASERGRRGMDELHEQTVNLLSFRELPKQVFDAQVAFNMLGAYGEKSSPTLESVERRILCHFRTIVGDTVAVPSLMLVQAPSFHGHAFSLYLELGRKVAVEDFLQTLVGEHVTIVSAGDEQPSNVSAAGQDDILVAVRRDAQHENALWLWATADNLRVTSNTAVDCAEALAPTRPKGKVQ